MTERQRRFAEYYIETGNARQSALRAGYSEGYSEHVKHQKAVKEYLEKRLGGMNEERVASADEVLMFLTGVMRGECGDDDKACNLRMKAAEMIARRMGYFLEDGEMPKEGVTIVDDIPKGGDDIIAKDEAE
jgi:phage terminase small subunit